MCKHNEISPKNQQEIQENKKWINPTFHLQYTHYISLLMLQQ